MLKGLDRLPLAAGVGAFGLQHLEPAVAFAVILVLAVILGDLQLPWPLQPFTPKQRPLKVSALAAAMSVAPEMIRAAAVMAILAPDFLVSFILPLLAHEL